MLNQYRRVSKEDTNEHQRKVKQERVFESIRTSIKRKYKRVSRKRLHGRVFESIRTSIERICRQVSKKDFKRTSVCINTDEYRKKILTSIKERFNTNECLSQYGWVSKEDKDEYQIKDYTDECLNQYRRVLKEDTDEYQGKVKHRRMF